MHAVYPTERLAKGENNRMPTAKEYRQQAHHCLELAKEAKELYAIRAMMELAEEFNNAADELERKSSPHRGA